MSRKLLKNFQDDLLSPEPTEGRLRLELRKLTNSEGWVSATRESSASSSRASTPLSHSSTGPTTSRRGRPPKKHAAKSINNPAKSNSGRGHSKQPYKPKKFQMVLEKDDDYEVDYISPDDDAESTGSSVAKDNLSIGSLSDSDCCLDNDDASSIDDLPTSPWMDDIINDDDEIPDLELPPSSNDLLVSNDLIMRALSVYEVLRHFRNCLRLSPFLFEDFCAALISKETTVLMNECHVTLLKALLKEEDHQNTTFAPPDQKDSYNASLYFMDYLTWPEVLRAYLECSSKFKDVLAVTEDKDYPSVEVSDKLKVLELLSHLFIASTKIRDELMTDGSIRYDDHCRVCHRLGDLLCCETCPAVYHLACCNPPLEEVPEDEWQCEICLSHKLNGVSDCETENEMAGQYLRHEPVGTDRHGRKYWFIVRRLFVESEDEVRYYSTYEEFKHVLSKFDHEKYEMVLCEAMKDVLEEFPKQAKITEELTNEARWKDGGKTCLEIMIERTKTAVEEEKKKAEAEEQRLKDEEQKIKDEEQRLKDEEQRLENEEQPIKDEEKTIKDEEQTIKGEEQTINDEKVPVKDEERHVMDEDDLGKSVEVEKEKEKLQEEDLKQEVEETLKTEEKCETTIEETTADLEEKMDCDDSKSAPPEKSQETVEVSLDEGENKLNEDQKKFDELKDTTDMNKTEEPEEDIKNITESVVSEMEDATSSEQKQETVPELSTTQNADNSNVSAPEANSSVSANLNASVAVSSESQTVVAATLELVPSSEAVPATADTAAKLSGGTVISTSTILTSNLQSSGGLPKTSLIPLNLRIPRVPLSRCDAIIGSASANKPITNQVFKVAPKIQVKTGSAPPPLTTLKNLFVLSRDGVKTPLTIGPGGKLVAGSGTSKLIMINPTQQTTKVQTGMQPQSNKLSRELRKLQFAGAGPKMQKIVTLPGARPQQIPVVGQLPGIQKITETKVEAKAVDATKAQPVIKVVPRKPFRLGEDDGYKQYKNYFVENTLALNKYQHKEEKDKDRHVGYKFTLTGPVEFEWYGELCGSRTEIVHTLRSALFRFEQQIPLCFMHSKWDQYRKMWGRMLIQNESSKAFAVVLGILEMAIRNNVKKAVWKESMGQVRMRRLTIAEKEEYEKKKKHRARLEEDIANRHAVWCKYPIPVRSTLVWKMRGEEYRVTGYGGWMWQSSTFRCTNQKYVPKPYKLVKKPPSTTTTTDEKPDVPAGSEKQPEPMEVTEDSNDSSRILNNVDELAEEKQRLIDQCDVVDVSKNLLVRSVLYNKKWATSKLDKLFRWRVLQEKERVRSLQEKAKRDKPEIKPASDGDANDVNVAGDKISSSNKDAAAEDNSAEQLSEYDALLKNCPSPDSDILKSDVTVDGKSEIKPTSNSSTTNAEKTGMIAERSNENAIPVDSTSADKIENVKIAEKSELSADTVAQPDKNTSLSSIEETADLGKPEISDTEEEDLVSIKKEPTITATDSKQGDNEQIQTEQLIETDSIKTNEEMPVDAEMFEAGPSEKSPPEQSDSKETITPEQLDSRETITPEQPDSRETITPEQPDSKETITPEQLDSRETITPEQLDSRETITPEQPDSRETITPEQPDSKETITPEQSDSKETITPEQSDSKETIKPEQPDSRETITPEQPDSKETITPDMSDSKETITPEQPDSKETITPEQPDSRETITPEQPDSKETITPDMSDSKETITPEQPEFKETANSTEAETADSLMDVDVTLEDQSSAAIEDSVETVESEQMDVDVAEKVNSSTMLQSTCVDATGDNHKKVSDSANTEEVVCNGIDAETPDTETVVKSTATTTTKCVTTEAVTTTSSGDEVAKTVLSETVTTTVTTTTSTVQTVSTMPCTVNLDKSELLTDLSREDEKPNAETISNDATNDSQKTDLRESLSKTDTAACEDMVVSHTYSSVTESSSLSVDRSSGKVSADSSTVRISRRFRTEKRGTIVKHDAKSETVRSSTSKTWKLIKSPADSNNKKGNDVKMPIPWKFSIGKGKRKSIFRVPNRHIRCMATRGGLAWHPLGFHHMQKSPTSLELFWPYHCARPTIGLVWRYKLQHANTLASIAHLLRVLWHSIRWDDVVTQPPNDDMVHAVHTDEDIVTVELLKRRDVGNTGLRSEYFVRRIIMPTSEHDEEIPRSEAYTPSSRSGLRTRGRQMSLRERTRKDNYSAEPKVDSLWMSEDRIELWQIRQFDTKVRMQQRNNARKEAEIKVAISSPLSTPLSAGNKPRVSMREALMNLQKKQQQDTTQSQQLARKHVTISPALLKQATALHRPRLADGNTVGMPKIIPINSTSQSFTTANSFPIKLNEAVVQTQAAGFQKITVKSPSLSQPQFVALKPNTGNLTATPTSGGTIIQTSSGQTFFRANTGTQYVVQGNKVVQRQILLKTGPTAVASANTTPQPKHPTIKLGGLLGTPKSIQPLQQALSPQMATKQTVATTKFPVTAQAFSTPKSSSNMQVKLSATQLSDLMKVGMGTVVKVSVSMADGKPGVGQLQMIPPGSQVTPTQGQQLMQCKVGSEIRRFLLTAVTDNKTPTTAAMSQSPITLDNEVTVKTPSLRQRLEQLQQRHQELLKQPGTNVHRLLTDKDPLWGGRTQMPDKTPIDKLNASEKMTKKDIIDRPRKKYSLSHFEREERQRRNVVQQVMKSILDRIDRKEELDARKRKKEEQLEMQKKKRESMDVAKSQQRMHSRLLHALVRHEEQLKQEIRKRKTVTEKYLTRIAENELYEDRVKMKRRRMNPLSPASQNAVAISKHPKKSNYITTHSAISSILTESNKKKTAQPTSPIKRQQKESRKRQRSTESSPPEEVPAKKKKMINSSTKLYCVCKTPYDETRFYIGCDLCMNWFHGECVGIREKKAKVMETWVCKECDREQAAPQQELYCICKTPYDDAQFYIGCDACQDWYHGACVGVSEDDAANIESYTCPRCKQQARDAANEGALTERDVYNLTKIIKHLQGHKMAWPFLEPVRESDAPGYYKVVKRPMDLQTVMKRLQCRYYIKLSELVGDVSLIFDNCRQYNGADSKIVRCAEIVETVFVGKMRDMRGR